MKAIFLAVALLAVAPVAEAAAHLTGSVATATTTAAMQTNQSQYGSASLDFDLGRYVQIGYTYGLEKSATKGWKDPNAATTSTPADPDYCAISCQPVYTNTTVVSHAVGLTLILYEGMTFMPYIQGGAMLRIMTIESEDIDPRTGQSVYTKPTQSAIPGPYAGAGLAIKLNREFSLKLGYQVSQGVERLPGQPKSKSVYDAKSTVGISYQL